MQHVNTQLSLAFASDTFFASRCLLLRETHEEDWEHFKRFTSLLPDLKTSPDWPDVEGNVVDQIVDRWRDELDNQIY